MKEKLLIIASMLTLCNLFAQDSVSTNKGSTSMLTDDLIPKQTLFSDYKTPKNFLSFGLGVNTTVINYNFISPNNYVGLSMPFHFLYERRKNNKITRYQLNWQSIYFSNDFNFTSIIGLLPRPVESVFGGSGYSWNMVEVKIDRLRGLNTVIRKNLKNTIYVGPQIHTLAGLGKLSSYGNNSQVNVLFVDLGPQGELNYQLGKKWSLNYQLALPLFAFTMKPEYTTVLKSKSDFYFIGNFFRLDSDLSFLYKIGEKSALSLSYRWQFINSSGDNDSQQFRYTNDFFNLKFLFEL